MSMASPEMHVITGPSRTAAEMEEEEEGEAGVEYSGGALHGDLLHAVISRLSLFDLLPASSVSTSWRRAAALSVDDPPRRKPWFIVRRRDSSPAAAAYDPGSGSWMRVPAAPVAVAPTSPVPPVAVAPTSPVRSSHGSLLYALSPSRFSLSWDPLNLAWVDVGPPQVWRADPLVALVGTHVVVAGGASDFEDDPLAVEVYDLDRPRRRLPCKPMPLLFKNSASPVWLSVAASDCRFFVLAKDSGTFSSLDLDTMTWGPVSCLRPTRSTFFSVIGFSAGRLIQVGLDGDARNVSKLTIWEVNPETFERKVLDEMPPNLLERLENQDSSPLYSIEALVCGDSVHVYDPSDPRDIFFCDFSSGDGNCSWSSFSNLVLNEGNPIDKFVFTCSKVSIDDIRPVWNYRRRVSR